MGLLCGSGQPASGASAPRRPLPCGLGHRQADGLDVHVLSADTYGSAEHVARTLDAAYRRVDSAAAKQAYVTWLGAERCVAVGNGRNDAPGC